MLPAAAPAAVVALSILFGAAQPTAAVLQGAGFAAVALAWAAARQQRGAARRGHLGRQRPWQRIGAAAAVLAVAGAGATVIGPHLPGASAHQRVVLYVEPPFDVSAYPSPLAGFRDYTKDVPAGLSVYGKELLATTGLPAGSRVRIAAMDAYDGLVLGRRQRGSAAVVLQRLPAGRRAAARGDPAARPARRRSRSSPPTTQPWLPDLADTTGVLLHRGGRRPGRRRAPLQRRHRRPASSPTGCPPGLSYTVSVRGRARARRCARWRPPTPGRHAGLASIAIPAAVQAFAQAHARRGDHAHGQGPRARHVPAGQRPVQQRRRRAERDHRRATAPAG